MSKNRRIALEAAIAALVSFALSLIVFGPLLGKLGKPWAAGDMLSTYVNTVNWDWWHYAVTTTYGFPDGMNLAYFPGVDITENLFAQIVNAIAGNPYVGINLLLVLSFPLVAALAYLAIRIVGLSGPLAIALAASFSLIPYHFGRGLGHMYLATMYAGVTGVILALLIGTGQLQARFATATKRGRIWLTVAIAILVIVTAVSGIYYAAFGLLLGAAALIWRIAKHDSWKSVGLATTPYFGIIVAVGLGLLPSVIAIKSAPPLASLGIRNPIESVLLAGNLAMALIPFPMSTLPGMERYNVKIAEAINAAPEPHLEGSAATNYGTWVTTACLVVMLIGLLLQMRDRSKFRAEVLQEATEKRHASRFGHLNFITYLTVVVILFFVPWGLNYLFAGTITPQIRGWNRLLPILLLLFVLGAAAVLANSAVNRKRAILWPVIVVILLLTVTDSVKPFAPIYLGTVDSITARADAATEYNAAINAAIPENCGILQLPYMKYPENGPLNKQGLGLGDYDHFLQPLANSDKKWSYGAVKNTTESRWLESLPAFPMDKQFADLKAKGFCGIHLDTGGLLPQEQESMTKFYDALLGMPVATGHNGRWILYSLR
ncbi:MAG: hypothetical protein ACKOAF_00085 [Actinomycetes bacterium]